ncbi:hypothetical protein DXG03_007339 [Asterophora parasitica]|uniref:Utp14-domain-containing protein n=1 Tax=Asterophora parasitica TaxID=117018 RepID=A0A9P7GDF1_9AGAR|nr:hypothetical protein DXG03_007339 [Asterophora parasitica]
MGTKSVDLTKINAAGYAKRQSRKAKNINGLSSDVYEYAPEATRRSKITLDLDHDEAAEYGVPLDGDNEAREELRARLIGENGDDEMIDSGDDEEIDSDAAFEESDEERFAGFFSAKGKKKAPWKKKTSAVKFAEVDLNEDDDVEDDEEQDEDMDGSDEEEEDDGEDDEFIDILDVLDGRGDVGSDQEDAPNKPEKSAAAKSRPEKAKFDESEGDEEDEDDGADEDEDDEDDDEASADEESDDEMLASDVEDVPEALDDLQNFISTLDPTAKKRKASDTDAPTATDRSRKQRRLTLKERTEAGAESEFRAQASGSKLNLDDLLAPLASQSSTLQSLKQSTKALASTSSKAKTLSAPLPMRAQERLDREAAYEQTKEEVDKWSGTMKRIREAEHLSFPLQAPTAGKVSNLELAAKFKPTTALESSVDVLLKSAKLREEDIAATEETMLKMNKLSVEEVQARRGELRKMRELMFRAEIKARRIGKIKSKTYRKIKRKERERLGEQLDEEGGSETEEGRLKREVERARERATLKHKHTGKWAKKMRAREGVNGEGRQEIEEMLARGEKLRRRIKGVGSDDESEDGESDEGEDGVDAEGGIERIKQSAFDELERIEREDESSAVGGDGKKSSKSIFEMKFMKDAMARQQHAADKMADDFVNEMGGRPDHEDDSDFEDQHDRDTPSGVVAQRTGGRISYHPGATNANRPTTARPIGSLASDTSSVTLRSTDLLSPPLSPLELQRTGVPLPTINESSNPWLTPRDESGTTSLKVSKKNNEVVVGKDSSALAKSKNKLKKMARKQAGEKAKAVDDAVVEISVDQVLTLPSSTPAVPKPAPKTKATPTQKKAPTPKATVTVERDDGDSDDDVHSEVEAQEKALDLKGKGKAHLLAFEQRDLVALAFAGDNVVHEFQEAKKREIAADAPREVDTTIPGWGSWGGAGTRKAPPKPRYIKKVAGVDPTTRADYGKANIIISEKRDKKAAKYMVKDLPFPYTSKAQFDKTMEQPLGTEWNTRVAFQRGTLPRVTKKPGMIINPLEKLGS